MTADLWGGLVLLGALALLCWAWSGTMPRFLADLLSGRRDEEE